MIEVQRGKAHPPQHPTFFHCPVLYQRDPPPSRLSCATGISMVRRQIAFYHTQKSEQETGAGKAGLGSSRTLFTSLG